MLVTLEMANNHDGDVNRGLDIIRTFAPLVREYPKVKLAFKFQYRDPSIIRIPSTSKMTRRVSETMLDATERLQLANAAKEAGFAIGCTPFDEKSVDLLVSHGYDFLKVASCSFTDWPLLEKVATAGRPVIASTAGAGEMEVRRVHQFLKRRVPDLNLMHCVAEYPTPTNRLNLERVRFLQGFDVPVGFSTHEHPDSDFGCSVAVAMGASVLEWHVGIPPLNSYSLTVAQTRRRLDAMLGVLEGVRLREGADPNEYEMLRSLRRGAWAVRSIKAGERVTLADVELAMPVEGDQLTANDFDKYSVYTAIGDIAAYQRLTISNTDWHCTRAEVQRWSDEYQQLFNRSGVSVKRPAKLILSHHYGMSELNNFGCGTIEVIREKDYAKKLILVLPGQHHPSHRHAQKTETFNILYGGIETVVGSSDTQKLRTGTQITINKGEWHSFSSVTGCVFEEVSTALVDNDSEYAVPVEADRKTVVWLP